jgi:ABC-2 type transport system ATP-binding protein
VIADGTMPQLVRSTVGEGRRAILELADPVLTSDLPVESDGGGTRLEATLRRPAEELPSLLAALAERGAEVESLRVESPSLHSVFLALTGRELRE